MSKATPHPHAVTGREVLGVVDLVDAGLPPDAIDQLALVVGLVDPDRADVSVVVGP